MIIVLVLAVLGLLLDTPLHGYEIRKQLVELLGFSGTISYGSLYPTLAKLHHQKLITSSVAPVSYKKTNVFSTGSLTGDLASSYQNKYPLVAPRKNKKVYNITEKGIVSFHEELYKSYIKNADNDKAFLIHLAFLDLALDHQRADFFYHRIEALTSRLNKLASSNNQALQQWNNVQKEYITNQISFLKSLDQEQTFTISSFKGES